MQTFLPFSDYEQVAETLDNKRLNKQILEGYQILKILSGASESGAWRNHPAVLMWKSAEWGLWNYIQECIKEAMYRGIKTDTNSLNLNVLKEKCQKHWSDNKPAFAKNKEYMNRLVITHRANLYIKDPIYYAEYQYAVNNENNRPCCERCKYFWPTHLSK